MNPAANAPALLFYDGLCGFCNAAVQWLLKHDKHDRFRFAAQQSAFAQELLARHGISQQQMLTDNSVYLVLGLGTNEETVLQRSLCGLESGLGLFRHALGEQDGLCPGCPIWHDPVRQTERNRLGGWNSVPCQQVLLRSQEARQKGPRENTPIARHQSDRTSLPSNSVGTPGSGENSFVPRSTASSHIRSIG